MIGHQAELNQFQRRNISVLLTRVSTFNVVHRYSFSGSKKKKYLVITSSISSFYETNIMKITRDPNSFASDRRGILVNFFLIYLQ